MFSNAAKILEALDGFLDHAVEIVIYGRASLALGFSDPPVETTRSEDVDVILPLSSVGKIDVDTQFWEAQQLTNAKLEPEGLYILHLFGEDQVFLRPDWEHHLVPITSPSFRWLRLFRPATLDLILTKMMRGNDEQDMADVEFMIRHDRISVRHMEEAMAVAVIPDLQELRDAFAKARVKVREIVSRLAFP